MIPVQDPKPGERGFALLVIFLLAGAVALMLYMQMPRVAFEAQRDKEQLLIDRGEQYKRAIQEYFVQFKKYPSKIEDLENTNNQRFLRRRYIDPMTGKDDWRLIHVNAAAQLTDSLVQPAPTASGASGASGAAGSGASGSSGSMGIGLFSSGPSGDPGPTVNAAVFQRPSDRTFSNQNAPAQPVDPNDPRYWPPITLNPIQASGPPGAPGSPVAGVGTSIPGVPTGASGTLALPGLNPPPQGQVPGQVPGQPGFLVPGAAVQATPPGGQVQLAGQGAAQNPALTSINSSLTGSQNNSSTQMGGGLAGVASPFKGPSIKIYNQQQKYQQWEFIFKLSNGSAAPTGSANPLQNGQPGQPNPSGASGALGTPTTTTGTAPATANPFPQQ